MTSQYHIPTLLQHPEPVRKPVACANLVVDCLLQAATFEKAGEVCAFKGTLGVVPICVSYGLNSHVLVPCSAVSAF